jgi:hypothetical protein
MSGELADRMNGIQTRHHHGRSPVTQSRTVTALKNQHGADMKCIAGSASVVQTLTEHRVVER